MVQHKYIVKKRLSVSECRQYLALVVDRLPAQGVVITKRGRPVAKLVPLGPGAVDNRPLFGALTGVLTVKGNIFSTGDRWNAES
jgi:prevent-host-death family protein